MQLSKSACALPISKRAGIWSLPSTRCRRGPGARKSSRVNIYRGSVRSGGILPVSAGVS